MHKYIITWVISQIISTPCPDSKNENEFGLKRNVNITCAVNHLTEDKKYYARKFEDEKEAKLFLKKLKEQKSYFSLDYQSIKDIKIDSVLVKN